MSATIAIQGTTVHAAHSAQAAIRGRTVVNVALWILQAALATLFLFAGGMKLVVPFASMAQQMPVPLSADFIHFIGFAELLGALGLILPGALGIRTVLTPLAAAGLAVIMAGAVGFTLGSATPGALVPGVVGVAAAVVALGRSLSAPHPDRRARA